jgi:hypothetical protein
LAFAGGTGGGEEEEEKEEDEVEDKPEKGTKKRSKATKSDGSATKKKKKKDPNMPKKGRSSYMIFQAENRVENALPKNFSTCVSQLCIRSESRRPIRR